MKEFNEKIKWFTNTILNEKICDLIKEKLPDKTKSTVFIELLYKTTNDFFENQLEENKETINLIIF